MTPTESARWLRARRPVPAPHVRLICLPYAGGATTVYHHFPDGLRADVEVRSAQLPARQERIGEPGLTRVTAIVERLASALEALEPAPVALYGHSFGAIVAFELARRLEQSGNPPVHLFVAARRAPHLPGGRGPIHALPDAAFAEALHRHYGTALALLQNTELMQLVMPSLRADFEALDTYRYVDGPPLAVPVTVLAGRRDGALASHEVVAAWRERTTGPYAEHWIDAGHFFVDTHRSWVLARIAEALTGDERATGP